MQCLHKLPAGTSETENGLFWFCNQKPTCNFICSEDEGYLYEMGIIAFERTKQPQPNCCGNNPAKLHMVKDMMKQNYGRPFFVCSKDDNRCSYFEWADETILPKPYCFHNETCKSWTVKKEGANSGKRFFSCPQGRDSDERCKFLQWAIVEEENDKDTENPHPSQENVVENPPPTQKGIRKRESDEKKQDKTTKKTRQNNKKKKTTPPVLHKTNQLTVVSIFLKTF